MHAFSRFLLAALLPLLGAASSSAQSAAPAPDKSAVVEQLRKGGCVVFLRHCKTNHDQADTDPLNLDNVKAQRQLSAEGRQQASAIGEALRALKIPFGKVISGRLFRAIETARLIGVGEPSPTDDVSEGGQVVTPIENNRRKLALKQLLSTPPTAGTNLLIVSHRSNLQDAGGKDFGDAEEAEAAVFQPVDGKFKLLARIPATLWTTWSKTP